MQRNLAKLILVNSFGRGAKRPIASAWSKISLAGLGALIFGTLLGVSVWKANLPKDLPLGFRSAVLVGLSLAFSALLQMSLNLTVDGPGSRAGALLASLPLKKVELWLVKTAPLFILNLFLLLFFIPITVALAHAMDASAALNGLMVALGSLAGLGFTLLERPKNLLFKVLLLAAGVFCEARSLELAMSKPSLLTAITIGLLSVDSLAALGFLTSFKSVALPKTAHSRRALTWRALQRFIGGSWFVIKTFRNKHTRLSFLFCLLLSTVTAVFVRLRHLAVPAPDLFFIAALLSAAYASDARGISRRLRTPEIVAIKGVEFFISHELLATSLAGLAVGLPIFGLALLSGTGSAADLSVGISLQLAAVSLGLLASTFLVPQTGDIGSQFFASLSAASAVFLLNKLTDSSLNFVHRASLCLVTASLAWLLIYIIELQRRKSYGFS